jgi:hypothetical protein
MESWQISTILSVSNPIVVLAMVAAIGMVAWTWVSIDPQNGWKFRVGVSAIRLAISVCAIYMLMQPSLIVTRTSPSPTPLAVVFDASASMGYPEQGDRLSSAVSMAHRALGARMNPHSVDVQFFSFAQSAGPVENLQRVSLKNTEPGATSFQNLAGYLAGLNEERHFAGVLLFSDGADTSGASIDKIREMGVPFNVAFVGSDSERKDILVKDIRVDDFAFSRKLNPIRVTLENHGLPLTQVKVNLLRDGKLLQQKSAAVIDGLGQLTFQVVPRYPGRHIYQVEIPAHQDEDISENNSRFVELNVLRDKYRVLHVSGAPSWDQRFLRDMLTNWPQVDLVSFYLLRTAYQSTTQSNAGLSLIPFPTQKLFTDHLREFDVVVFQDFAPESVGVDAYLDQIAAYLKDGGALVVTGGMNGLTSSAIAQSKLGKLLPMGFPSANTPTSRLISDAPFAPVLTDTGKRHPLFIQSGSDELPEEQIRSLPRLNGIVRMKRVQNDGQVLMAHSHIRDRDHGIPLIAVSEAGNGRALVIATDSLWTWGFSAAMTGAPGGYYSEFWKQTIRWLTRSRELSRLTVDIEPEQAEEGGRAAVNIGISAMNRDYTSAAGKKLTIQISWRGENQQPQSETLEGVTNGAGMYRQIWHPRDSGPHRVRVSADEDKLEVSESFLVAPVNLEMNHLSPNAAMLREISEATGGEFFDGDVRFEDLKLRTVQGESVLSRKDTALWSHPLALLLLFGLALGEWALRRSRGLI